MAFSIETYGLPTLHNYAQALKHYESIKPIKSKKYHRDKLRPIGGRRQLNKTIYQLFNGDIACRLYSTACVVYHQDDSITVDFGVWRTNSTSAFIRAISPYSASTSRYVSTNKGTFKVPSGGLKILPDGTPVNPVQEYRTLLDKKKAAETRKKLKPFLTWVKACLKLGGIKPLWADGKPALRAILERDCYESYQTAAGVFFGFGDGRDQVLGLAYGMTESFIKIPVPLGTERRPTQWD